MITLEDRKSAVLKEMASQAIDSVLILASGRHMIDESDALMHMTGFLCMGPSLMLLRADGRATLIATPASDAERLAAHACSAESLATDDLLGALRKVWPAKHLGKLASVNLHAFPYRLAARLQEFLGENAIRFDSAFFAATRPKTAAELASARRAVAIAERGWDRLQQIARPGMRECDLAVEVHQYMRSLGADDSFFILNSRPQSPEERPSTQRLLQKGDMLIGEPSPRCEGQFAQICRTASLGPASDDLAAKYALLCTGLREGIATIRPGIKVSDICAAINASLAAAGFAEYSRPPHIKRRGHGFGCGSTAPGDVALDNHTVLEEDMMFMLHPNQVLPGPGFMMCGDPVRVTATGVEVLSQEMAKLAVIKC